MSEQNSSWRQIQQQLLAPAITPIATRRRQFVLLKKVGIGCAVLALVAAVGFVVVYFKNHAQTFAPYAQNQARTQVKFFSDGQLTQNWFNEQFPTLTAKGLLSIDITAVQSTLLKSPQVLSANIERHFPATLKITLTERQPIGRLKVKNGAVTEMMYVAADGILFSAPSYKPAPTLPFIAGANLRSAEGQLQPLTGMGTLAELLEGIKTRFGDLYTQISLINLSDWQFPVGPQTCVTLKTRAGTVYRFGPDKVAAQLDRLAEVMALLKAEPNAKAAKSIDLTYPDKVSIVGAP